MGFLVQEALMTPIRLAQVVLPLFVGLTACAVSPTASRREPAPITASECRAGCRLVVTNKTGVSLDVSYHSAVSSPFTLGTVTGFREQEFIVSSSSVPMVTARLQDGQRVRCARLYPRTTNLVRLECGGRQ